MGTGVPEVGGLSVRDCAGDPAGAARASIWWAPTSARWRRRFDPSGHTALNAANLMFEMLCVVADSPSPRRRVIGEGDAMLPRRETHKPERLLVRRSRRSIHSHCLTCGAHDLHRRSDQSSTTRASSSIRAISPPRRSTVHSMDECSERPSEAGAGASLSDLVKLTAYYRERWCRSDEARLPRAISHRHA